MTFPTGDDLVALVTFLLVLVTVASIVATWTIAKSQEKLQTEISANSKAIRAKLPAKCCSSTAPLLLSSTRGLLENETIAINRGH